MDHASATAPAAAPPVVDVVILSWDRVPDTIDAVDSVLRQRGVAARVFVIDQGTAAGPLQALEDALADRPGVTLVCNAANTGVPGGRNQGTALGTAPYVASLDNDAVFVDDRQLAAAVRLMEADERLAGLAFRIVLFATGEDDRTSWAYWPKTVEEWGAKTFPTNRFVGAGHLLRRSFFDRAGGYDDKLFFMHEEEDLCRRLVNLGGRLVYSPEVTIRHKVSPDRRVAWNAGRMHFHVRNLIYISTKFYFGPFSGVGSVVRVVRDGFRNGFALATLKACLAGAAMMPGALRQRWTDPRVRMTPAAKAAHRAVEPAASAMLSSKVRSSLRSLVSRTAGRDAA